MGTENSVSRKVNVLKVTLGEPLGKQGDDSFTKWAESWLRLKKAAPITDKQKDNYRRGVNYWERAFQNCEIRRVNVDEIEQRLVSMQEIGYATRTINFYRSTIRQIMQRAVGRAISFNPVDLVQLTGICRQAEQRRALTAEEQQWIWNTPHRAQPVAIIMMLSGLRRGELAALTWNDVDLSARTIIVNKTVEYPPNKAPRLRNITKSNAGMRTVDIPRQLVNYMSTLPKDNALVIHNVRGGIMTECAWLSLWRSYMRLLNIKYGSRTPADLERMKKSGQHKFDMTIPRITLHWLRHTYCTLLYLSGVDAVQACAQMGHADVTTTLKIYTHLDAIHKRNSMDKLDAYLSNKFENHI